MKKLLIHERIKESTLVHKIELDYMMKTTNCLTANCLSSIHSETDQISSNTHQKNLTHRKYLCSQRCTTICPSSTIQDFSTFFKTRSHLKNLSLPVFVPKGKTWKVIGLLRIKMDPHQRIHRENFNAWYCCLSQLPPFFRICMWVGLLSRMYTRVFAL